MVIFPSPGRSGCKHPGWRWGKLKDIPWMLASISTKWRKDHHQLFETKWFPYNYGQSPPPAHTHPTEYRKLALSHTQLAHKCIIINLSTLTVSVTLKSRRIFLISGGTAGGNPRNNSSEFHNHGCYHYCDSARFAENDNMAAKFPACCITTFPLVGF